MKCYYLEYLWVWIIEKERIEKNEEKIQEIYDNVVNKDSDKIKKSSITKPPDTDASQATTFEGAAEVEEDNETIDEDSLPPNWQNLKDPSTGKTYFYNKSTGVTTYERPT